MKSPVSICMAVHNGETYLRDQLDSILSSLQLGDELLISDDHSTDNTLEIIKSYTNSQLHLLPSQVFQKPAANFEYVLSHCKHNIIFLADQDDVWRPEKIDVMRKELTQCDLVLCDCSVVDENLTEIIPSFFEFNKSRSGLVKNLLKNSFVGCCMAFHRSVLEKALPFPAHVPHDQWIGLVALKHFNVKLLPQKLVLHRRHGRNYSTTGNPSRNSIGKKLISRFRLATELTYR